MKLTIAELHASYTIMLDYAKVCSLSVDKSTALIQVLGSMTEKLETYATCQIYIQQPGGVPDRMVTEGMVTEGMVRKEWSGAGMV
jgi:hypothetical protein